MKSRVVQIQVNLLEGSPKLTGTKCFTAINTHDTYAAAQHQLAMWGYDASPQGEGYTKCEATILWENGDSFGIRYDLNKGGRSGSYSTLRNAIQSKLEIYAGVSCPEHLKDHIEAMLEADKKFTEGLKRIYETCEV
jgi:hypothetical protein